MPRPSLKMASSFWSEPTQCKPSKSWRSCGSAAPGRRIATNTQFRGSSTPNVIFDFLLENTPDQVYFKDRRGRFLRASRAVAELLGASSAKDLIGKSDFDFWSMETARETAADEQRIMKTREPLVGKIERLVHPDGRISWDYTTKMPLLDTRGEVIGICGINKDFTAMKCMQDALEEERDRLKATIAELESKNARRQADLQLARDIGVLKASGPGGNANASRRSRTSRDRQESNTRAGLGAVKACPRGWVGFEELLVRTGRASSNALVFAVSQRESHEQGFGGEAFGGRPLPSA